MGRYGAEMARALCDAAGVAPGAYAASLGAERRQALKEELRRSLETGDEPFRLTARAWVAAGRVTG